MKKNIIRLTLLPVIMILAALSMTGASYGAIARFHVTYPYGHQAADDPTLEGAYNNWVGMFVVNAGSYKRVSYPEGIGTAGANSTASEGIGYGMLLAVWFNDQTTFNNLWNYKVNNSPKSGLMAWEINSGGGIMDQNSASDADEDIAMALILADRRWGSGGSVNYNQLAVNEVNKVGSNDISSSDYHVYPGDLQGSDGSGDYPSYFTPAWYVEFGAVTGNGTFWGNVVTKCYTNLSAARDASGLATEQCSAAGAQIGSVDGYNSSRIPWRYSLDYVWNGTASSLAQITMDANFFAGKSGNGACCATYNTNGGNGTGTATCNDATYNGQRAGPAGTSMLVSAAHATDLTNFYSAASTFLGDSAHCYNATLALLSVLEESGNAPKMFGTPQATPTPLGGDIFDNCEDGDNVDLWGGYWYTYDDRDTVNKGDSYVVPWTQAYAATMGKTPPAFAMMAPGIAPGSMAYGARMTGNVTTTYTYGFVGMGAGTNFDSGSPDFAVTDVSMYTGMYIYIKSNSAVNKLDIKLKCAVSVTNTASNDFKYTYTGTTYTAYVTLPFSVFTQATGWGITVSQALVLKNLTDVQFQTSTQPMAGMDFEVDDIMFYPAKTPTPSPTFCAGQLVDNCEDGDNVNIFGGFWSSYMDTTGITTVWPSSVTYTPFVMSAPGANASLYCARMTGTVMGNTTTATFAGMSTNMLPLTYTARNMSVFVGLTFWVKGDNHQYSIKLMPGSAVNDGQNDYKYTFMPPLSGGWQQMNISFSSFTQEHGWGTIVTLASVLQNLLSLHWESKGPGTLSGNHTYDLSVDDVEFECSQGWTPTATVTLTSTIPAGTNTFTPTPTRTASPTLTATPTFTMTYTRTATPTFTYTQPPATNTFTSTVTFTRTATPTFTYTPPPATNTFTSTVTSTRTATPTFTYTQPAATSTFTATYTLTRTATPSGTATYTGTPTHTYTSTLTYTGTSTFTSTRTGTPTVTASPSITDTWTAGYGTNTNTPTITQSWTSSASPTRTATGTVTPTYTGTFTRTMTSTYTSTSTRTATNTPPANTPTNTPTGTNVISTLTDTPVIPTATDTAIPTDTIVIPPTATDTTVILPTATDTQPTGITPTNTPVTQCLMLDNCDDGDNANMVPAGMGGPGYWYSYDDFYNAGTSYVVPWTSAECTKMGVANIPFYMQSPGCDGAGNDSAAGKAARITGYTTNADTDGGFVGMGMNLLGTPSSLTFTTCANYSPSPMDISGYTGLRFWVKGDGQSYLVKMPYTDPCTNNLDGYDDYQCLFPTVASTWTQIVIPFAAGPGLHFAQQGWGTAVNFNIVLQNARAIQFATQGNKGANLQIDLSVDNVELYVAGCGTTATNTPVIVPTNTNTPVPPTVTNTPTTAPPTATSTIAVPTATATTATVPSMVLAISVPATAEVGQVLTVILTVTNNGTSDLTTVWPTGMTIGGTANIQGATSPATPVSLAMGSSVSFTWTYDVLGAGTASFTVAGHSDQATAPPITSSNVDCPAPTPTNTPVIPTATFTRTVTPTVTRTSTPVAPTATFTPTVEATSGTEQITGLVPYPNPFIDNGKNTLYIDFNISQTTGVSEIGIRIYTQAYRRILAVSYTGNDAVNVMAQRKIAITGDSLSNLANGTYYYYVYVVQNGKEVRSKVDKVIILR